MYVIGDAHGQLRVVASLLQGAGLIGSNHEWSGGGATLWFTGDFCDRGPDGAGVVRLVRRLQQEAEQEGGRIGALMGNHEIMLLAARRYPQHRAEFGSTYYDLWSFNGGRDSDLKHLSDEDLSWIAQLPAVAVEGNALLLHCDATFYAQLGDTVEHVNERVRHVLQSAELAAWDHLMERYFDRGEFVNGAKGRASAERMLRTFGGKRIVHGHTPIPYLTGQDARTVTAPVVYADGLCMDVDGGIYMGGPGFVVEIDEGA